jgi:hypothetical protein
MTAADQIVQREVLAMRPFSNRVSLVNGSLIASPLSTVLSPPRVTVLSAVGIVRRNIWSEAQALQGPQRADVQGRRSTATNAATRTLARRATITPAFSRG